MHKFLESWLDKRRREKSEKYGPANCPSCFSTAIHLSSLEASLGLVWIHKTRATGTEPWRQLPSWLCEPILALSSQNSLWLLRYHCTWQQVQPKIAQRSPTSLRVVFLWSGKKWESSASSKQRHSSHRGKGGPRPPECKQFKCLGSRSATGNAFRDCHNRFSVII